VEQLPHRDDERADVPSRDGGMQSSLPACDHEGRREDLRARLREAGLDLLLVTAPANVRYLSGFAGSNGQVLLAAHADGDRLITDERYEERAAHAAPGLQVVLSRDPIAVAVGHASSASGVDDGGIGAGRRTGSPSGSVDEGDRDVRRPRLGFEAAHLTWHDGERLRRQAAEAGVAAEPTTESCERLRVVKDAAELARLERACRLTVDALAWLLDELVAVGRTERELAVALERRFLDLGADGVAFPSIVASGPNSAIPHHAPTDRRLEPGDLLTIDCGALVDGYHADFTRTVAIGHLDDQLAEVHEVVRRAQEAGRAAAVAGASAGDVDGAARTIVDAAGYGERFVHGTGHGVGLDIHEAPAVARRARATLAAGTALTVEPGIYLPGRGGVRIEDSIVVTADGPARTLTDAPRELRIL
jgi:Xaa-Pro aminopeptidase